jgi:hypothetical protein
MTAPKTTREIIGPINDVTHCIQRLDTIDSIAQREDGTVQLALVVAGRFEGDTRSQARLVEKLGNYLHYVASADYQAKFGAPSPEKTSIVIKMHQGGAPVVRTLLSRLSKWARDGGVSLVLEIPEG